MGDEKRPRFIMCVCTGKCPGFEKMDIWDFINRIRIELPVEYGIIHPQLCEEDGDRYLDGTLVKGQKLIVGGCAPRMQRKLFRDAFSKKGMDIETDLIPIDIRDMTTDEAVNKVIEVMQEEGLYE